VITREVAAFFFVRHPRRIVGETSSHIAAIGRTPAACIKRTIVSAVPDPASRAMTGATCPGRDSPDGTVRGSAMVLMVCARSAAEIPVPGKFFYEVVPARRARCRQRRWESRVAHRLGVDEKRVFERDSPIASGIQRRSTRRIPDCRCRFGRQRIRIASLRYRNHSRDGNVPLDNVVGEIGTDEKRLGLETVGKDSSWPKVVSTSSLRRSCLRGEFGRDLGGIAISWVDRNDRVHDPSPVVPTNPRPAPRKCRPHPGPAITPARAAESPYIPPRM